MQLVQIKEIIHDLYATKKFNMFGMFKIKGRLSWVIFSLWVWIKVIHATLK